MKLSQNPNNLFILILNVNVLIIKKEKKSLNALKKIWELFIILEGRPGERPAGVNAGLKTIEIKHSSHFNHISDDATGAEIHTAES